MRHPSIPSAQLLVQYCKAMDISRIVISPGSRNAPLIIGFTEDAFFNCYSIVDERAAAFFAIGMSQQLKRPVAVLCTSGSALLNYYPAVAEAYYSDHPLLVISADRPPYKIDIGDGQTIRQDDVFDRHIGYSANLKLDVSHATATISHFDPKMLGEGRSLESLQKEIWEFNSDEIRKAMDILFKSSLPVHINVPFEEPLYETTSSPYLSLNLGPEPERAMAETEDLSDFQSRWNLANRKMILVGVMSPGEIGSEWLNTLANDPSVLIFTETTSNLHHPNIIPSIDSIVAPIEKAEDGDKKFRELQPEILLTFGGLVVSKKIKAFLRKYKPVEHWHVNENKAFDTYYALNHHFKVPADNFLAQFIPGIKKGQSNYQSKWLAVRDHYKIKRTEYLRDILFSDMWAFEKIIQSLPKGLMVQLANSSTVRYAQLFDMGEDQPVFCNRGTSGIDGSTSTAVGAALHYKGPTVLITGDLSFFYDSNGLWNTYIRPDFRIIVINNGGGGIFRILPGKEDSENFKTFFETTHQLKAAPLCELFHFEYLEADDKSSLKEALKDFYTLSERPKLLEVRTPANLNDRILLEYFDFIS
ncbi:2-succinyl-5-enolpyruvyl-6-hydroxy-3-cyclohexene-1-carboxylate synthase [Muriicola sp. E247]|uniref:2-succinyl-5-enolpyruvyl-6-hydroxy-3- cyclohexene-1-carboxylate synthase n=1 Tax=Muriicola sp. E247 TaxID=3242730 RepID=UPI003523239F